MKLLYPTRNPYITQRYGVKSSAYKTYHHGTDFRVWNDPNRDILAAMDGTVVEVNTSGIDWYRWNGKEWVETINNGAGSVYGNYVIIEHDGYYTMYGHLQNVYVNEGETVRAGRVIGKGGNTGKSKGAHLHFELREGKNSYKNAINAEPYFVTGLEDIPEWGRAPWAWGKENNILSDLSSFDDKLTKGELMVILKRFYDNLIS
jgi:murein DD-endopeptidase MepM/ murein hydrolase activator NlpD